MRLVVDERTLLRSFTVADGVALFGLIDANRAHLREWLPWLDANPGLRETLEFIERAALLEELGRGLVVGIERDGLLVGVLGFNVIDPANRSGELGYWLSAAQTGQGLMTACARSLARHAFDELDLHRITIPIEERNRASRAVAERLGARAEGTMRDAAWLYDHYVNLVLYAVLDDELT